MDDREEMRSPWPILVALGIAVGELGVLFGNVVIAVGGVLLFGGGGAAIVRDAGLSRGPWRPLVGVGVGIGVLGLAVWSLRVSRLSTSAFFTQVATDAIAARAAIVAGAAVLLVVIGLVGVAVETQRTGPENPA